MTIRNESTDLANRQVREVVMFATSGLAKLRPFDVEIKNRPRLHWRVTRGSLSKPRVAQVWLPPTNEQCIVRRQNGDQFQLTRNEALVYAVAWSVRWFWRCDYPTQARIAGQVHRDLGAHAINTLSRWRARPGAPPVEKVPAVEVEADPDFTEVLERLKPSRRPPSGGILSG
jgi:hypothetical protein